MAIWDDFVNWLNKSAADNNIAANVPLLGSYYNALFPAPPQAPSATLPQVPTTPKPVGKSKNINLPNDQRTAAIQKALMNKQLSPLELQPQQPQQPVNTVDPLMQQLMQQLIQNVNQTPVSIPQPKQYSYDQLYDMYSGAVNAQYDPLKSALQKQIDDRKVRYDQSATDISNLYANAGATFGDTGADFDALRNNETQRLDQYKDYLNNVYSDSAASMANEFNTMGIQDVGQYSSPKQAEDLAYLQTLNQNSSDSFQRYLDSSESAANNYSTGMQGSYSLAGAEQGEDLLNDYNYDTDLLDSKLAEINAQKTSAITNMILQSLMQQDKDQYNWQVQSAQNQQTAQNAIFDRLLSVANLQRQLAPTTQPQQTNPMDILNQQYKQLQIQQLQNKLTGSNQPQQNYTKGLMGAAQYLNQAAPNNAQNLTNMLYTLLQQQPFREDKFQGASGDIIDGLTPEQAANYAMQLAQQQNLSPQDTTALVNAIYAYYGKLQ